MTIAELKMTTGLTRDEAMTLRGLVRAVNIDPPYVADVGSWKGFSCAILASEVKPRGGKVVAVDHWEGNPGTWNIDVVAKEDILSIFKHNMEVLGFTDIVDVLSMSSNQALNVLQDNSFSLVFLDADHRYTSIKEDIKGWWQKLRIGGILCGHDCEARFTDLESEIRQLINEHLEDDYLEVGYHPGVIRALYDCFGNDFSIANNTRIWYHRKS